MKTKNLPATSLSIPNRPGWPTFREIGLIENPLKIHYLIANHDITGEGDRRHHQQSFSQIRQVMFDGKVAHCEKHTGLGSYHIF